MCLGSREAPQSVHSRGGNFRPAQDAVSTHRDADETVLDSSRSKANMSHHLKRIPANVLSVQQNIQETPSESLT